MENERAILHCDLNNFFASVECLVNKNLEGKPVAVAGSLEERKGVILAKNYLAKDYGIKTGHTIIEAKKLCPDIIIVRPNIKLYNEYSEKVRQIYLQFTDMVEPFSIDECWLDVTHSKVFGTPVEIANKIREKVKNEIGLTISVGVSFNKIFAKMGSDLKKPDATTVITKENFKKIIWKLPVEDMLGIGKHTKAKLNKFGIKTIGELAHLEKEFLVQKFGKIGAVLFEHSNGINCNKVENYNTYKMPKSVGNSTTYYKDLNTNQEVLMGLTVLSESISKRIIEQDLPPAKTLYLSIKNNQLQYFGKMSKFEKPALDSKSIVNLAFKLFKENYDWQFPVRLLGISVSNFCNEKSTQLSFFDKKDNKKLEDAVLKIRAKMGTKSIGKANKLFDKKIGETLGHDIVKKK